MTPLIEWTPLDTNPGSTDEDSPQPFRFLDLPGEIRNNIYERALGACDSKDFELELGGGGMLYASKLPCIGLLRTCKQVYQETKDIPYELHAFDLRGRIAKMSDPCPSWWSKVCRFSNIIKMSDTCPFWWSKVRRFSNINIYLFKEADFKEILAVLQNPKITIDTLDLKFGYKITDLVRVMAQLGEADAKVKKMVKVSVAFPAGQVVYQKEAEEAIANAVTKMQGYKEADTFSDWMEDGLNRKVFMMVSIGMGIKA